MAAITGKQDFINNLDIFLDKANLTDSAKVWYSFWPESGQSNYEMVFNSLIPTGQAFLQRVADVAVKNGGNGYGISEVPSVAFVSNDAGFGASGTAIMTLDGSVSNFINNSDFSQSELFWMWYNQDIGLPPIQAPRSGQNFAFESGVLHINTGFDVTTIAFSPNSGQFFSGANPYWMIGELTISKASVAPIQSTSLRVFAYTRTGTGTYQISEITGLPIDISTSGIKTFSTLISVNTPVIPVLSIDSFDETYDFAIDNFMLWTGDASDATSLQLSLTHAWPAGNANNIDSNLIFNGDFSQSGQGWYSGASNPAGNSGLLYKFESGVLHVFRTNPSIPITEDNNIFTLRPNSGILLPTGFNFWIYGSFDLLQTDNVTRIELGDFNQFYTSETTGTKYFGYRIINGTGQPFISFSCSNTSNLVIDNFKLFTGDAGRDAITSNPFYSIICAPSTNKDGFRLYTGYHGAGFYDQLGDNEGVAAGRSALRISHTNVFGGDYTIAFRRQVDNPQNQSQVSIADWPNISLGLSNGKYAMACLQTNTKLSTQIPVSNQWDSIVVSVTQTDNGTSGFLYINGSGVSGLLSNAKLAHTSSDTMSFYGTESSSLYNVAIDEIYQWNRALNSSEISELAIGACYPFDSTIASSRYVKDIVITNSGVNYLTEPTIVIAAPVSGGVAAQAVAFLAPDTSRIYAESLPGLSVGDTNNITSGLASGTGTFISGNNDFLRVGNILNFSDWTLFMNFSPSGRVQGISRILVSSMDSISQPSGLMIGINDSNRLFFEYIDDTHPLGSCRRIKVHDEELGKNNLIAFSKDTVNKVFTICVHDLADHDTRSTVYQIQGYNDSNTLYLGGFPNSGNITTYTGFQGQIFDVLLLTGAANAVQCDALSKVFFITGYTPSGEVPVAIYYPIVTGAMFGTGGSVINRITGYGLQPISIPDKDGSNITVYDSVPLTGNVNTTGIVYLSGNTSGVRTILSGIPEEFFFSNVYIKQYTEENLVFLDYSIVNTDMLEVYSFSDKQFDKISVVPDPFNLNDFYLLNSFDPNSVALVFNNGLLQLDGSNYFVNSGKIVSHSLSTYHSLYDFLMYDEVSGNIITSGFTGYIGATTIVHTGDIGWISNSTSGAGQPNSDPQLDFDGGGTFSDGLQWSTITPVYVGDIVSVVLGSYAASITAELQVFFGIMDYNNQFQYIDFLYDIEPGEETGPTNTFNFPISFSGYPAFYYLSTSPNDSFVADVNIYRTSSVLSDGSRDVYLNGQKLVSGFDYRVKSGVMTLTGTQNGQSVSWASGILAFPSSRTGNRQTFTGSGLGFYKNFASSIGTLMDEMIWLNGQRLTPDYDYEKVSNMSLLLSTTRPDIYSFPVYTGDSFPLNILTGKPNIS